MSKFKNKKKVIVDKKTRIMDMKWLRLKKEGTHPPATMEENQARAKAAHGY